MLRHGMHNQIQRNRSWLLYFFQQASGFPFHRFGSKHGSRPDCDSHKLKPAQIKQRIIFKYLVLHALHGCIIIEQRHLCSLDVVCLAESTFVQHGHRFPDRRDRNFVFFGQCGLRRQKRPSPVGSHSNLINQIAGNLHVIMVPSLFRTPVIIALPLLRRKWNHNRQFFHILFNIACDRVIHCLKTPAHLLRITCIDRLQHPHRILIRPV